jgi:hypothetical protein
MMLKIEFEKIKMAYGLIKDIKGFYIHASTSHNSRTERIHAGYTVFPGIDTPPRKPIPHLTAPSSKKLQGGFDPNKSIHSGVKFRHNT